MGRSVASPSSYDVRIGPDMPFVNKGGGGDEDAGDRDSLRIDLDPLACPVCRRELLPWQDTCPDDGVPPVRKSALPPVDDPLLARLLEEEGDHAPVSDPDRHPDGSPRWPEA